MVAFTAFVQWILFFFPLVVGLAARRDCLWALTCWQLQKAVQSTYRRGMSERSAEADLQGEARGVGKAVGIVSLNMDETRRYQSQETRDKG